jgi:hypothetical protein
MDAIIFDIDGTLADVAHRRHFLSRQPKNYDAFYDAMVDDPPMVDVCWLAERLAAKRDGFALFVFSGRPDTHRERTEGWLRKHVPALLEAAEAVLMRPGGDYRPDTEIKREMLRAVRSQGFSPRLVIDDRPSVVQMWKDEGLQVLEVDSGEWEAGPKVAPGTLYLLVGPSGAGKSYLAASRFSPDMIVSSDQVRVQFCGDFRDQSRNAEVFAAVHAVAKARIESGLDAVIDATNLRNRDRKAILDKMPDGAGVCYLVIDRSMADKWRDAGWRADVKIKGVPLIEKHDQTFRSNLKDILAGDGDPRVTVEDLRC